MVQMWYWIFLVICSSVNGNNCRVWLAHIPLWSHVRRQQDVKLTQVLSSLEWTLRGWLGIENMELNKWYWGFLFRHQLIWTPACHMVMITSTPPHHFRTMPLTFLFSFLSYQDRTCLLVDVIRWWGILIDWTNILFFFILLAFCFYCILYYLYYYI